MVLGKVRNFMCHNLGADTNANPLAPSQQIHGAKYQWGTASPFVTQAQDQEYGDEVTPPGWASVITPNGAWLGDGSKGTSDPCPEGYRVPTSDETNSMLNSNTLKWTGPYETSPTNYFSGMQVISKTSGEFTMFCLQQVIAEVQVIAFPDIQCLEVQQEITGRVLMLVIPVVLM